MSEFRIDEQESWEQQAGYSGQEDYWIPESELCRKCHKKRIDRSENSHSILCRECREEQIPQFEDEGMVVDEEFAAYLNGEVDYYDYYVSPQ